MADLQRHYKQKGLGFGNVEQQRIIRAGRQAEARKGQRTEQFAKNRNVSIFPDRPVQNAGIVNAESQNEVVNDRRIMLQKWRAERDLRKKVDQMKKKPAFKVGIVHHSLCSPPIKDQEVTQVLGKICKVLKPKQPSPKKRVTRATEKRLMAKASASGTFTVQNIKSKPTASQKKLPLAPENHMFKPPAGLPIIPLFGRVVPQNMTPTNTKKFIKNFSFTLPSPKVVEPDKPKIEEPFAAVDCNVEHSEEMPTKDMECANENVTYNSSIETVQLRLSSDEQESPVSLPKTDRNSIEEKSNDDVSLNTPPCPETASSVEEPVFFSPYIVTSRGKSGARKEQKAKRGLGSPVDDIPTKDTVMQNLNISIEEEERTAQYFKFILNREIDRLQELCKKWSLIKSEPGITEDAIYSIVQTIGQTELLMRKKFERFRSLVTDCETGKGQMLVTCKDLQGFWDMTYMEVKNCDSRFENLEKLRANGWVEEEQPALQKPAAKKKVPPKKKVVSTTQSSIRALILAARKEKMIKRKGPTEEETIEVENQVPLIQHRGRNSVTKEKSATKENTRRSTSFNTSIQKSTPMKSNNTRHSLLWKVQLSETSKRLKSPLTIMKISQKCKTPEVHLDESISYVNSDQTPGRSILKKVDEPAEKENRVKTANKVIFDEHIELNEVPVDAETQNKLDLQAALRRIENYVSTEDEPIVEVRAERKLNFDDDSSDESITPENIHNGINSIPDIKILPATPLQQLSVPADVGKIEITNISPHLVSTTRILRNRTITSVGTPRKSRSIKVVPDEETEDKENAESTATKRRSSSKRRTKNENKTIESESDKVDHSTDTTSTRRKSTRKSVRFNAEECTACVNAKPVQPMTPHARRSRSRTELSFLGERDTVNVSEVEGDLIAWDSPKKLPSRVRRSSKR